jgi:hypothetical protein
MNSVVQKMAERIAEGRNFPAVERSGRQVRPDARNLNASDRVPSAVRPQNDNAHLTVAALRHWLERDRPDKAIARHFDIDIERVQALRRYYGFPRRH